MKFQLANVWFIKVVKLEGGRPWGFKIAGGAEVNKPILITKVKIGLSMKDNSNYFEYKKENLFQNLVWPLEAPNWKLRRRLQSPF